MLKDGWEEEEQRRERTKKEMKQKLSEGRVSTRVSCCGMCLALMHIAHSTTSTPTPCFIPLSMRQDAGFLFLSVCSPVPLHVRPCHVSVIFSVFFVTILYLPRICASAMELVGPFFLVPDLST